MFSLYRLTTIDYVLVLQLVVYFITYWVFVVFFNPEREWSLGLHETVGPCNEVSTLKTPFGPVSIFRVMMHKMDYFLTVKQWRFISVSIFIYL